MRNKRRRKNGKEKGKEEEEITESSLIRFARDMLATPTSEAPCFASVPPFSLETSSQLWGPRHSQLRCSSHRLQRHSRKSHFGGALHHGGSATFACDFSQL